MHRTPWMACLPADTAGLASAGLRLSKNTLSAHVQYFRVLVRVLLTQHRMGRYPLSVRVCEWGTRAGTLLRCLRIKL